MNEAREDDDRLVSILGWLLLNSIFFICIVCDLTLLVRLVKGICFISGLPVGIGFSPQALISNFVIAVIFSCIQTLLEDHLDFTPPFKLLNLYPHLRYSSPKLYDLWIRQSKNYRVLQPLCGRGLCGEDWAYKLASDIWQYHWVGRWFPQKRKNTLEHIHGLLGIVGRSQLNYEIVSSYIKSLNIPITDIDISPMQNRYYQQPDDRCPLGFICETMTGDSPSYCLNQEVCRFHSHF